MITISLCMIVKNEQEVLARCLNSAKSIVDEIIIVDTGSCDRTKEIALTFTDKVFDFPWINDFSAARNFSYSKAVMDYQMWLDADDVIAAQEAQRLLDLKKSLPPDTDMVTMKYHTHFDSFGVPILTSTRERLTRREKGYRWQDPVHECIPMEGTIFSSDITIWHQKIHTEGNSTRNLDIYQALEAEGAPLSPRQQYYFARELTDHGQHEKARHYFQLFLDGGKGWGEDNIAACFSLGSCCRALGKWDEGMTALRRSFSYAAPRAEVCCLLGYYYMDRGAYQLALDWFCTAASLPKADSLGFVLQEYWGFIPNIEACVCHDRLGRREQARQYNERAAKFHPNHPAVLKNRLVLAQ